MKWISRVIGVFYPEVLLPPIAIDRYRARVGAEGIGCAARRRNIDRRNRETYTLTGGWSSVERYRAAAHAGIRDRDRLYARAEQNRDLAGIVGERRSGRQSK